MDWTWDEYLKTHLCGTEDNGCGVFQDRGLWTANVSFEGHVENIGFFIDLEDAQEAAEDRLNEKAVQHLTDENLQATADSFKQERLKFEKDL